MMRRVMQVALIAGFVTSMAQAQQTAQAPGAMLRGLDKVSGQTTDFELAAGKTAQFGRIWITLIECRYPAGNRAGDAFAALDIREADSGKPDFQGWMIASSPALSALDHPRYDVWVIRCTKP